MGRQKGFLIFMTWIFAREGRSSFINHSENLCWVQGILFLEVYLIEVILINENEKMILFPFF